jgi:hypothetical protein
MSSIHYINLNQNGGADPIMERLAKQEYDRERQRRANMPLQVAGPAPALAPAPAQAQAPAQALALAPAPAPASSPASSPTSVIAVTGLPTPVKIKTKMFELDELIFNNKTFEGGESDYTHKIDGKDYAIFTIKQNDPTLLFPDGDRMTVVDQPRRMILNSKPYQVYFTSYQSIKKKTLNCIACKNPIFNDKNQRCRFCWDSPVSARKKKILVKRLKLAYPTDHLKKNKQGVEKAAILGEKYDKFKRNVRTALKANIAYRGSNTQFFDWLYEPTQGSELPPAGNAFEIIYENFIKNKMAKDKNYLQNLNTEDNKKNKINIAVAYIREDLEKKYLASKN